MILSGNDKEQEREKHQRGDRQSTTFFLVAGTLASVLFFADAALSVYYYQNTDGADLRWLLALLDLGLVLTLFALAGRKVSRLLVSMKLALTLLFVLAIVSIIGTILPTKDNVVESGWVNNPLYEFYDAIGLFEMYYTRWFLFILFLLAANLSWCIYKRLHVTLKNAIHPRVDVRDSFIINQPHTARFDGRGLEDFRRALSGHRYRVHQADSGAILAEKGRFSALASIAFHLSIIVMGVGAIIGGMLGWSEQLYVPDGETASVPNTEMEVTNHGFNVEYTPVEDERGLIVGYQPIDYSSDLEVFQDGESLDRKTITVNGPLRTHPAGSNSMLNFFGSTSINFHQSAYDLTEEGGYATILEVNYRPGMLLVIVGLGIMMIGITIALFFPHRRIWAKVGESGELLLGGRTNRAQVSFARDFQGIVSATGQESQQEAGTDV